MPVFVDDSWNWLLVVVGTCVLLLVAVDCDWFGLRACARVAVAGCCYMRWWLLCACVRLVLVALCVLLLRAVVR